MRKFMRELSRPARGWVFNPYLDSACFVFPLILGLVVNPREMPPATQLIVLFDSTHLYATALPFLALMKTRDPMVHQQLKRMGTQAAFTVIAFAALFIASQASFWVTLSYLALFHFMMQYFGWFRILSRKSNEISPFDTRLEYLLFWLGTLTPLLFWHTGLSVVERGFLNPGDFVVQVEPRFWQAALSLFLVVATIWLTRLVIFTVRREQTLPLGKLMFFGAQWACLFGGLVLAKDKAFFGVSLLLTHAFSYYTYVLVWHRNADTPDAPALIAPGCVSVLVHFLIFAALSQSRDLIGAFMGEASYSPLIFITPAILHYTLDGMIWKRSSPLWSLRAAPTTLPHLMAQMPPLSSSSETEPRRKRA